MAQAKITITGSLLDRQLIEDELSARGLAQDVRVAGSGEIRSVAGDALNYVSLVADIGKDLIVGLLASYIYDALRGGSRDVKLNGTPLSDVTGPEQIEEQLRSDGQGPPAGKE